MTNRVAVGLFLVLCAAFGLAWLFVDQPHLFLGRKFIELVHWIAFWR